MAARNQWLLLVAMVLALTAAGFAGCGGGAQDGHAPGTPPSLAQQLPALPVDTPEERVVSAALQDSKKGFDNWANSGDITVSGDNLVINAAAGQLSYAMFRYGQGSPTATPSTLDFILSSQGGEGAWLALADYAQGAWDLSGPYTDNVQLTLGAANYLSSFNHVFACVIAFDGTQVTLSASRLRFDDPSTTVTYVENVRPFLAANCFSCHSALAATAGVVLESYQGTVDTASQVKAKVAANHMGTYDALDQAMVAEWADNGAPLGQAPTYNIELKPQVFSPICMQCHASTKTGAERSGAPPSVDWDSFAAASSGNQPNRGNIRVQAGTMPPGFSGLSLTAQQQALFQAWIDAGWPE